MPVNTYPTVGFNPDVSVSSLIINGSQIDASVADAISDAQLERVMVGASTLTLTIEDPFRVLTNSTIAQIVAPTPPGAGLAPFAPYQPTTCEIVDPASGDKLVFCLCAIAKTSDQLTLTFEDFWINALRYSYAPGGYYTASGTMTRADFMQAVIRKALPLIPIPVIVVPDTYPGIGQIETATGDSQWGTVDNPSEDAWTCLVRLANAVQWRCFSSGDAIVIGPDSWLLEFPVGATFVENTGGVDSVDFNVDMGQAQSTATVHANTELVAFRPGTPIRLTELGIATSAMFNNGLWLASDITRSLFFPDATIGAIQQQPSLTEAQLAATVSSSTPAQTIPDQGGSTTAQTAVGYALAQIGKPYVWGGTGPGGYDCSGLCYAAYASAGLSIPRTSEDQWSGISTPVNDMSTLLPGDLIFYNWGEDGLPGPGHVVMYVGNGNVVEAAHTGTVISVHPYYGGYVGARRPAP